MWWMVTLPATGYFAAFIGTARLFYEPQNTKKCAHGCHYYQQSCPACFALSLFVGLFWPIVWLLFGIWWVVTTPRSTEKIKIAQRENKDLRNIENGEE